MAAMNATVYVLFRTRLIFPPINGPKNIIDMSALMTRVGRNRRPIEPNTQKTKTPRNHL